MKHATVSSEGRDVRSLPMATQWAFLAGLIEADGCITLTLTPQGYFNARVQLANQSLALHDWVRERFGGCQCTTSNRSVCFTTSWDSCAALKTLLGGMLPYLVSKRKEALLLLEYANGSQGRGRKSSLPGMRIAELSVLIKRLKRSRP